MQNNQTICHGCLSHIDKTIKQCPYCGRKFGNNNPSGTLPSRFVIAGRYILDKCVALDGEGVTYTAVDANFSKRVLVKEYVPVTICSARTNQGQVVPRRDREVLFKTTRMDFVDLYRSLMSVEHAVGLCRVYDLVEANNTAYAIQEPPTGTSLSLYLRTRKTPLTYVQAIALLRPIFLAVEAMNKKGLLHRGVSPDTIFISSDGRAKLSGFATIGLRTADSELRSQIFEGYSAPEQYSVAEFDGKYTDVYGLAAVFYKTITGVTPPSAVRRRMSDTLVSPKNLSAEIPPFVSIALMRALRLTGIERMDTASKLLQHLSEPTKSQIKKRHYSFNYKMLPIVVGVVAVLGIITVLFVMMLTSEPPEPDVSSSLSQDQIESSQAQIQEITVPNFINQSYADVQQAEYNIQNFSFSVTEEHDSVFGLGKIMEQTPKAGEKVLPGTVIQVVVSKGALTVEMPQVVGKTRVEAKAALDALGITYDVLERANDGTHVADTVVDCDVAQGTAIDPLKVKVTLYVAQEAAGSTPASSSSSSATP